MRLQLRNGLYIIGDFKFARFFNGFKAAFYINNIIVSSCF